MIYDDATPTSLSGKNDLFSLLDTFFEEVSDSSMWYYQHSGRFMLGFKSWEFGLSTAEFVAAPSVVDVHSQEDCVFDPLSQVQEAALLRPTTCPHQCRAIMRRFDFGHLPRRSRFCGSNGVNYQVMNITEPLAIPAANLVIRSHLTPLQV